MRYSSEALSPCILITHATCNEYACTDNIYCLNYYYKLISIYVQTSLSLRERANEFLSIMIHHQVLNVVNKACNENAYVEELMTVSAHVESAWLASLWDSCHVQASANSIDKASQYVLLPSSRHH